MPRSIPVWQAAQWTAGIVVLCLVLLFVLRRAVYVATGVYVGSLSPWRLRVKGIHVDTGKATVLVSAAGLRLNFWGRRELVEVVVDGLTATVKEPQQEQNKTPPRPTHAIPPKRHPLSLFPSSPVFRSLVRILVGWLPRVRVTLRLVSLSLPDQPPLTVYDTSLVFRDRHSSTTHLKDSMYVLATLAVFDAEFGDCRLEHIKIEGSAHVERSTGAANHAKLRVYTANTSLLVLDIITAHRANRQFKSTKRNKTAGPTPPASLVALADAALDAVVEVSLHLQNTKVHNVPLLLGVASVHHGAEYGASNQYCRATVQLMTATYRHVLPSHPGYDMHFDKLDRVFELVGLAMLTEAALQEELLLSPECTVQPLVTIPNLTFLVQLNILDRMVRVAAVDPEYDYHDCKCQVVASVLNPVLDMLSLHLPVVVFNLRLIKMLFKWRKHERAGTRNPSGQTTETAGTTVFSRFLPAIHCKITIDKPLTIIKDTMLDGTLKLVHLSYSLLNLLVLLASPGAYTLLMDFLNMHVAYTERCLEVLSDLDATQTITGDVLRVLNLYVSCDAQMTSPPLFKAAVSTNHLQLDLADLEVVGGLRDLVLSIHDAYSELRRRDVLQTPEELAKPIEAKVPIEEQIFQALPAWVDLVLVTFHRIEAVIGCLLMLVPVDPSMPFAQFCKERTSAQTPRDRGALRARQAVTVSLERWHSEVARASGQSDSLGSDLDSEGEDTLPFWSATSSIAKVVFLPQFDVVSNGGAMKRAMLTEGGSNITPGVQVPSRKDRSLASQQRERQMLISEIELAVAPHGEGDNRLLDVRLRVLSVTGKFSIYCYFLVAGAAHMVKNVLMARLSDHATTSSAPLRRPSQVSSAAPSAPADLLRTRCSLGLVDVVLEMPEQLCSRIQLTNTQVSTLRRAPLHVSNAFLRVLLELPQTPGYWQRLLCVNRIQATVRLGQAPLPVFKGAENSPAAPPPIEVATQLVRFHLPYKVLIYRVFGGITLFAKTVKQINHAVKTNSSELVIEPCAKPPIRMPRVRVKAMRLMYLMEDDPFECELNMIYQVGLLEQRIRLEKLREFEARGGRLPENNTGSTSALSLLLSHPQAPELLRPHPLRGTSVSSRAERPLLPVNRWKRSKLRTDDAREEQLRSPSPRGSTRSSPTKKAPASSPVDAAGLLLRNFAKLWVHRIRKARLSMAREVKLNQSFLFEGEDQMLVAQCKRVLQYSIHPPLLNAVILLVTLDLNPPQFDLEKVPEFVHRLGKGMPVDTEYLMLFPVFVELKAAEARAHLRDYPLPFVYIPAVDPLQPKNTLLLTIKGHLVVGEQFNDDSDSLNHVFVPMLPHVSRADRQHQAFSITVARTLAMVKCFADLRADIGTCNPTRCTWGALYAPALQQLLMNFDAFSKPPIDQLPKVGMWDKVRLMLHGRFALRFSADNGLQVNLKGLRDPYDLLGTAGGFTLGFNRDVVLEMNKDDDPARFIQVLANQVTWVVPNHLLAPLPVWCRDLRQLVMMSLLNRYVNSVYGYQFIPDVKRGDGRACEAPGAKTVMLLTGGIRFTLGFLFERDVKSGVDYGRDQSGRRTFDSIPHYKVRLRQPLDDTDSEAVDLYAGFRSDYVHMAFTVSATSPGCYNTVSPLLMLIQHFMRWWRLFSGTMLLPIRNGPLFGPKAATNKLLDRLYTVKFQFAIKPVFLLFIYHDEVVPVASGGNGDGGSDESRGGEEGETATRDTARCIGLKAKVEEIMVDLHLRKEAVVISRYSDGGANEEEHHKRAMKMTLNLGEVAVNDFDLRLVDALFGGGEGHLHRPNRGDAGRLEVLVFDGDELWVDRDDFEEFQRPLLRQRPGKVRVLPLMQTPRFVYYRDIGTTGGNSGEGKPFGDEPCHQCLMEFQDFAKVARSLTEDARASREGTPFTKPLARAPFQNQFILEQLLFKWNNANRNALQRFFHLLSVSRAVASFGFFSAIREIEESVLAEVERQQLTGDPSGTESRTTASRRLLFLLEASLPFMELSAARLENFDDELVQTNKFFSTQEDFLVRVVQPQIQLVCDELPDAALLVLTPLIDLKIVLVVEKNEEEQLLNQKVLEKRYGAVLHDATIYVVRQKVLEESDPDRSSTVEPEDAANETFGSSSAFRNECYGTTTQWPPWLTHSEPDEGFRLMHETLIAVLYTAMLQQTVQFRPEALRGLPLHDRLEVDLPKTEILCDLQQYMTLFKMVFDLLMYRDPELERLQEEVTKLAMRLRFGNPEEYVERIQQLVRSGRAIEQMLNSYNFRQGVLDAQQTEEMAQLSKALEEVRHELFMLMAAMSSGSLDSGTKDSSAGKMEWAIRADDIILHMMDDERKPFVDMSLMDNKFRRLDSPDGFNDNKVLVRVMQALNLEPDTFYPSLIRPYVAALDTAGCDRGAGGRQHRDEGADEPDAMMAMTEKILSHFAQKNMAEVRWKMSPEVGNIRIMEFMDIDVQPVCVELDEKVGDRLIEYLFQTKLTEINQSPILTRKKKDEEGGGEEGEEGEGEEGEEGEEDSDGTYDSDDLDSDPGSAVADTTSMSRSSVSRPSIRSTDLQPAPLEADSKEMMRRAEDYYLIVQMRMHATALKLLYNGQSGLKRMANVHQLELSLPEMEIANKTWSALDITMFLKSYVIKALLKHTGSYLGNRLVARRRRKRVSWQVKPLTEYVSRAKEKIKREK